MGDVLLVACLVAARDSKFATLRRARTGSRAEAGHERALAGAVPRVVVWGRPPRRRGLREKRAHARLLTQARDAAPRVAAPLVDVCRAAARCAAAAEPSSMPALLAARLRSAAAARDEAFSLSAAGALRILPDGGAGQQRAGQRVGRWAFRVRVAVTRRAVDAAARRRGLCGML